MNAATTRHDGSKALKAMTALLAAGVVLGLGQTALAPPIANGASFFIAGPANHNRLYWIDLPGNVRRLRAQTAGGAGNISLLVNFTTAPVPIGAWAFQSHNPGNNEVCTVDNPPAGRWYIRTRSWSAYGGVNLRVRFRVGPTWQQAAIQSAPSIIEGITAALANRSGDPDDDDDDRDDDRTPGPYTPADRVRMTTLTAGEWVNGCDGEFDSRDYYRVLVAGGAEALTFTTRGGSGNCLMLVRRDALPNGAQFDRRSNVAGTCQAVAIDRPRPGVYYVRLVGDPRFRDVQLTAALERAAAAAPQPQPAAEAGSVTITPLTNRAGQTVNAGPKSRRYFMINFATAPRRLAVTTRGGRGSCHLYVRRNALPTRTEFDWRAVNPGADQTIVLIRQLTAGTYYVMVDTDRGFRGVTVLADATVAAPAAAAQPAVSILTPLAGSPKTLGRTYEVTWRAAGMKTVRIAVSWNNGRTWQHLATLPAATPRFLWYVPTTQALTGDAVQLRIADDDNPQAAATRALTFVAN